MDRCLSPRNVVRRRSVPQTLGGDKRAPDKNTAPDWRLFMWGNYNTPGKRKQFRRFGTKITDRGHEKNEPFWDQL